MNPNSSSTWPAAVSGEDDEFTSFLEFSNLDIDFGSFDPVEHHDGHVQTAHQALVENMHRDGALGLNSGELENQGDNMEIQMPLDPQLRKDSHMEGTDISHTSHHDFSLQASHSKVYHRPGGVPPTPNSLEIHGAQYQSFHRADPHANPIYDAYHGKQDQMVFTPLVSPAVTPLDTHFRMPDYAVPGEYFSPLTSPALQAQVHSSQRLAYDVSRVSEAPDAASPIATTFDAGSNKSGSIQPASKRTRKNSMCAPNKVSSRSVRESPAMKPQRKKQSSSNSIITKDVTGLIEAASEGPRRAEKFYSKTDSLNLPISQDTSEVGSISPEPLSEILMPPPAAPKSNSSKSPSLNAKSNSPPTPFHPMGAPVTPASLMKLQGPSANSERTARWTCKSPVINAMTQDDSGGDQSLQRGNSHSHTNLAMNKNVSGPPSAAGPTLCATSAPQRPESKAPAKSNKRTNSSHPSPALRPRVSPSIKPLLPEGSSLSAETSALLLASKSNYQNIIEGTHLPGVLYPEALSENLTSKRTSHKIAEQGRRNRINGALQEIAALLPSASPMKPEGGSSSQTSQNNSKANTVEQAIDFIKALQKRIQELEGKLEAAEAKIGMQSESGADGEAKSRGEAGVTEEEKAGAE